MYLIMKQSTWIRYGEQYGEDACASQTPIATCDLKKDADAIARELRKIANDIRIIHIKVPHNPKKITPSMKKKARE